MKNTITIDFETYFNKDYSLKKLSTIEYVRDDQFKAHGCAIKFNDEPSIWVSHNDLQDYFNSLDISSYLWIAHNGLFDFLVLSEIFGVYPKEMADTLSMAKGILPPGTPCSLENLAKLFKLGKKGDELNESKGIKTLDPELELKISNYAKNDADLAYAIYLKLRPYLPDSEMRLISTTQRWGTQAVLELNVPMLRQAANDAEQSAAAKVILAALDKKLLRSNKQFAEWLKGRGITPPMKISPSTGKLTWSFAKNDLEYQDFKADHPELAHILAAKEAVSSRIEETRANRMIFVGTHGSCKMIMPLNYYGADNTGRFSGAGKLNVQNLGRGSKLRKAIEAPLGSNILVADSAQIELRINMWFCGVQSVLNILANDGDVYSHTATQHFGFKVTKKTHNDERQFGKLLSLGLGYGMGYKKFRIQAALGALGTPKTYLSEQEAYQTVQNYRNNHAEIKGMWDWLTKTIIPGMATKGFELQFKCVKFVHGGVELPNGMMLLYPDLQCDEGNQWTFDKGGKRSKLYGGLMLENIVQALARIVVFDQMMATEDRVPSLITVSSTHDEFLGIETIEQSQATFDIMIEEMSKTPAWAPGLPVKAEGGFAKEYSK